MTSLLANQTAIIEGSLGTLKSDQALLVCRAHVTRSGYWWGVRIYQLIHDEYSRDCDITYAEYTRTIGAMYNAIFQQDREYLLRVRGGREYVDELVQSLGVKLWDDKEALKWALLS